MNRSIRNLIIGKSGYIESGNEFRQIMLSGQYALVSLLVLIIFWSIDLSSGIIETSYIFGSSFLIISSTVVLHRKQLHCYANYILFPTFNIIVFLIASSENISTGSCLFFLPIALGSVAVFNYSQRKVALAFVLFSFLLGAIVLFGDFSFFTFRSYSDAQIRIIQIINLIIVFIVSMMAIYLLIRLSHYNTKQLLKSNLKLGKLNEELDRFVYSTSHDLRAPLTSVQGLLNLSAQTTVESERKHYQNLIIKSLASLDKFIHDITDYSRNNRLQVVQEPIQLASLVNEIWESLRYSIDAQSIEFINDIDEQLTIKNDVTRLRVVLSNLIANAVRYHDHRKEKKYIKIFHQALSTSFSLHVQDNGQGIAPEFQNKVFDMFFRGNESSQGSGLGLYIVKETLAKLSATIELISTPRQGSTFSITMPI